MLEGLESMFGGQQGQKVQDFIKRYQQGAPADGIDAQETADNYQQIAPQLPADVYRDSARDAFERLTPRHDHRRPWLTRGIAAMAAQRLMARR
jgi:hypothetical protein